LPGGGAFAVVGDDAEGVGGLLKVEVAVVRVTAVDAAAVGVLEGGAIAFSMAAADVGAVGVPPGGKSLPRE